MRAAALFPLVVLIAACSQDAADATAPPTPAPPARTTPPASTATVAVTTAPTPPPTSPRPSTPSPTAQAPVVRYIAIGASDTVGVGATDPAVGSWPARVAALLPPGSAYVNFGVSGSLVAQAREQQLPRALAQRPSVVSVWLAVNDLNARVDPGAYRASLASVIGGLVSATDAMVFVGNVPDLRAVPAYHDADKTLLAALIAAYNDAIASVVAAHPGRVRLVDLYTGSAPLVSTITVSADGFHPSDEGYRLIAERFISSMRASGVPLR